MDPDDYDDEPMNAAEVEGWREAEESLAAIDRAFAEIADGIPPELREFAEALFNLGALRFDKEITAARRRATTARDGLAGIQKAREQDQAIAKEWISELVAEYRTRHPETSTRSMANNLAKQTGVAAGTLRDRIRRWRLGS